MPSAFYLYFERKTASILTSKYYYIECVLVIINGKENDEAETEIDSVSGLIAEDHWLRVSQIH